jgi:hypothetical protein
MASATDAIQRGARVSADAADGTTRDLRALTGVVAGGDFAVVWACSEREWEAAQAEDREPKGIPWPAEDVRLRDATLAHV